MTIPQINTEVPAFAELIEQIRQSDVPTRAPGYGRLHAAFEARVEQLIAPLGEVALAVALDFVQRVYSDRAFELSEPTDLPRW